MAAWTCRVGGLCVLALVLGTLCVPVGAQITTVTLQDGLNSYTGTRDNSIYSDNVNNSNGAGQSIIVGRVGATGSGAIRHGLISFDLASLPANIQIIDVTLELNATMTHISSFPVTVYRISNDWGEGSVDAGTATGSNEGQGAAAGTGDATWNSRHHGVSTWTSPGGDYNGTASGTGSANLSNLVAVKGAGMIADVQGWANGSFTNNGWIIVGNETVQQTSMRLDSSESTGTRPALRITYQPITEIPRTQWLLTEARE